MGANDSQSFLSPITYFGTTAWKQAVRGATWASSSRSGKVDGRAMLWVSVPIDL